MPTSYLDLEGLEYLWGKAGETFSPKNIDASSIAANGIEGKTVSDNNPLVIKDVAYPQNTKDIVVDLSPVQDFNGYDKPWVGGAGKNLLPLILSNIKAINTEGTWNGNAYTRNGITFTINTDSSGNITGITANGTASGSGNNTFWIISYNNLISFDKDVILNGVPSGSTSSTYYIGGSNIGTMTSSVTKTAGSEFAVALVVASGVTVSNIVFKPMVRLATNTDDTFEPYENICPIYPANGRNLLPLTIENLIENNQNQNVTWNDNSCVINGITFTAQTDSNGNVTGILANGTATKEAWISIIIPSNLSGDYYFTGCPLGGSGALYDVYPWDSTSGARTKKWDKSTTSLSDFGNQVQQINIVSGHTVSINCRIFVNVTVSNLLFKPMILSASSDPTFIPYQSVGVNRTGKNLLQLTVDSIKALNTSGSWSGNEYTWNGITYTIMTDSSNNVIGIRGNGTASARGWIFLAKKDFGQTRAIFTSSGVLENNYYFSSGNTLDDGTKQFIYYNNETSRTYLLIDNGHVVNDQIWYPMIRLATETDATFEPYQPTSITLSLGQDVYGGTYDIGKGELTIDRAIVIIDGSRTTITSGSTMTNQYGYTWLYSLMGQTNIEDFLNKSLTNKYVFVNKAHNNLLPYEYTCSLDGTGANTTMRFVCNDPSVTNKTTLLEWLANNPVELVYPLETPITISLSSDQLSLLQGYNVISSSDGISGIEVTYDAIQESTVQAEIDELGEISRVQAANSKATDDAIEEVRNAIDDLRDDTAIVISSVSSESKIASFNDGVEGFPVRDLEIEFEPVQDLHGYSKPWVGGAGKNKLNLLLSVLKKRNASGTWDNNNYTFRGITFSFKIGSDGDTIESITANGTSTNEGIAYIIIAHSSETSSYNMINGNAYTITNGTNQGKVSYYDGTTSNTRDISYTFTYDSSKTTANWTIGIATNQTVTNIVFKPMIRLATEADATFEPYSNICPIYPANSRNLLENTATTQTINGVTFSVNSDDTITANGTATSDAQLVIGTVSLKGNTAYVINGCPSGGGSSTYRLYFEGVSAGSTYDNGSGATYTPTEDENRNIKMVVYSGATVSNLVFKPMICLASEDSTFTPYQAIEVKRTGKNLLDVNKYSLIAYYNGTLNTNGITAKLNTDGTISISGTSTGIAYINLSFFNTLLNAQNITSLIGKTVIFSCEGIENVGDDLAYVGIYKSDGTYYNNGFVINKTTPSQIYTFKNDAVALRMFYKIPSGQTRNLIIKPMMHLVSTEDNTYEPYTSTTLTLPLDRDVYGGRYNVVSGELMITHVLQTLNGSETWTLNNANSDNWYYSTNLGTSVVQNLTITKQYSNMYESTNVTNSNTDCGFWVIAAGDVRVREQTQKTIADWKTYLASNPLQVVYELANPLTYQLTPQQLTTLSKSNVIMTDSGYISNCEYYADAKIYVDERYMKLYMKLEQTLADIDYLTMLTEDDNMSPNFEKIRDYYRRGLWNLARVEKALEKGWITQEEFDKIVSE